MGQEPVALQGLFERIERLQAARWQSRGGALHFELSTPGRRIAAAGVGLQMPRPLRVEGAASPHRAGDSVQVRRWRMKAAMSWISSMQTSWPMR